MKLKDGLTCIGWLAVSIPPKYPMVDNFAGVSLPLNKIVLILRRASSVRVASMMGEYFSMYAYMSAERVQRYRRTADGHFEKRPMRDVDEHLIIGTESNVASTKVMVEYLIATVERLTGQECYGARAQHAFKVGCADRLYDRLVTLRRERERSSRQEQQAAASDSLPVLADVYTANQAANEELFCKIHGRLPCGGGTFGESSDIGAYARGNAAGGSISSPPR